MKKNRPCLWVLLHGIKGSRPVNLFWKLSGELCTLFGRSQSRIYSFLLPPTFRWPKSVGFWGGGGESLDNRSSPLNHYLEEEALEICGYLLEMNDDLEDLPCLWYHRIPLAEPPPGLARPPSTPTTWVWSVTACFVGGQSVVFPTPQCCMGIMGRGSYFCSSAWYAPLGNDYGMAVKFLIKNWFLDLCILTRTHLSDSPSLSQLWEMVMLMRWVVMSTPWLARIVHPCAVQAVSQPQWLWQHVGALRTCP